MCASSLTPSPTRGTNLHPAFPLMQPRCQGPSARSPLPGAPCPPALLRCGAQPDPASTDLAPSVLPSPLWYGAPLFLPSTGPGPAGVRRPAEGRAPSSTCSGSSLCPRWGVEENTAHELGRSVCACPLPRLPRALLALRNQISSTRALPAQPLGLA